MKVRTLIIAASVTLALVVPVAASAQILEASAHNRIAPAKPATSSDRSSRSDAATIRILKAQNKALAAKIKALQAENKALRDRPVNPGTSSNPTPQSTPTNTDSDRQEYCYGYMLDCTDAELCTIWGINCGAVAPMVSTPAEESPAVAPAAETAVAGSSESTGPVTELTPAPLSSNVDENEYYGGGF